jgi:uncharacterized protein (TIGR02145 family)
MQHKKFFLYLLILSFIKLAGGLQAQTTVKDIDGNIYLTVNIGKQVWIAENLKTTKLNDGKAIPVIADENAWKGLKTPALCWYNNDIKNKDVYGGLYNWYTVNTRKLCPKDWHVPTDSEWETMITFLGDINTAGDKLKEKGITHWENYLSTATDEFDFTALPGGFRYFSGVFPLFGSSYAVWWSSTGGKDVLAWNRGLHDSSSRAFKGFEDKRSGFSVRCIKD